MSKVNEENVVPQEVELSEEEKAIIEEKRLVKKELTDCGKRIGEVLKEHNCNLVIDMNSPINNPRIVLVHNKEGLN